MNYLLKIRMKFLIDKLHHSIDKKIYSKIYINCNHNYGHNSYIIKTYFNIKKYYVF